MLQQLELTLDDIKWALVNAPKLGIKANQVTVVGNKNRLRIFIEEDDKFGRLKSLKRALPSVVVKVSSWLSLCRRMVIEQPT